MSAPVTNEEGCEEGIAGFESSELGTKEFWDRTYDRELGNFQEIGDEGEIWFGPGCMNRAIKWIKSSKEICKESRIVDLGCGNGLLLIELAKLGYKSLTGLDYSQSAIDLARSIAEQNSTEIDFKVFNLLEDCCSLTPNELFDVAIDKGTYDAISLNPQDALGCRQKYIDSVLGMLDNNGYFILISCNWTKDEITQHFSKGFIFLDEVPSNTFQFGGKKGNSVTSIIFRKRR